jgi:hypothetical protein
MVIKFDVTLRNEKIIFMKKISLLSLAFISCFAVMAQTPIGTDPNMGTKPMRTEMSTATRFGIRAGVNLATLEIDDDSQTNPLNTNNKTSFHAGLFVNVPIGGGLHFQPELIYSGQGSKISTTSIGQNVNNEYDMHYLTVPLMFQWQSKGDGGFFAEAGPQIAFLLRANDDNDVDIKETLNLKTLDYGVGLGLGYLTRIGLGVNARYNLGFANIYDQDANNNDDGKYKNRVINLGLVYHFGAAK